MSKRPGDVQRGLHSKRPTRSAETEESADAKAQAWKKAMTTVGESATSRPVHARRSYPISDEERIARLSIYYDPVTNPTGTPPAHKPVAYLHPDGVIRSYLPESARQESSSESSSSSDSEDARITIEAIPVSIARSEIPLPGHPQPKSRPPPPRPLGSTASMSRPVLPKLNPIQNQPAVPIPRAVSQPTPLQYPTEYVPSETWTQQEPLQTSSDRNSVVIESQPTIGSSSSSEPVTTAQKPISTTSLFIPSSLRRK